MPSQSGLLRFANPGGPELGPAPLVAVVPAVVAAVDVVLPLLLLLVVVLGLLPPLP